MNHDHGLMADTRVVPVASDGLVDTAGAEGVVFVAHFGAAADTNKLTLNGGDAVGGGDQAVLQDADGNNAELTMDATATVGRIECHKPAQRYISVTAVGTSTITAHLYGHRTLPTTPAASANQANFVSPE